MSHGQIEPQLVTYLHNKGGRLGLPIAGTFELTARCNFRCPMCYVHESGAEEKELTAEQWITLAHDARDRGMVFALLTGGEPFLRKDFFEIYDAMRQMGILVSINSNGSLLDGEIRERLLENPPARLNVSLYGGCRETYRNMCGQDAFARVTENIRVLKEAGLDMRLNLSITSYNRGDMEKIHKIAQELDIPIKASSYMYPPIRINGGVAGCGDRLTAEEAALCTVQWDQLRLTREQFLVRAQSLDRLVAPENRECAVDPESGVSCRAGSSSFWMTWDGQMRPCGMMPGPTVFPLETGFDRAWDQLRRMTRQIRTTPACTVCEKREVCPVCAAVCVTETGTYDGVPEYVCRMTEETIRLTREAYGERMNHDC